MENAAAHCIKAREGWSGLWKLGERRKGGDGARYWSEEWQRPWKNPMGNLVIWKDIKNAFLVRGFWT